MSRASGKLFAALKSSCGQCLPVVFSKMATSVLCWLWMVSASKKNLLFHCEGFFQNGGQMILFEQNRKILICRSIKMSSQRTEEEAIAKHRSPFKVIILYYFITLSILQTRSGSDPKIRLRQNYGGRQSWSQRPPYLMMIHSIKSILRTPSILVKMLVCSNCKNSL